MSQHGSEPGFHVPTPTPTPAMIRWLGAAGLWLLTRLRPDHSSLYGGWYQQNLGGHQHLYVSISCAPRRRLKKPRRVDALEALAFLNKLVPGGFSSPATTSHDQVVAFETAATGDDPALYPEPLRAGRVWANGRVELFVRAPVDTNGERVTVDLAGAFAYFARFVEFVNCGDYRRLYGFTRARRLDWFIGLSNNYNHPQYGSRQWDDLRFPGRRPLHRATSSFAYIGTHGLAPNALRSRRQGESVSAFLRPALTDLINNSGWYDGVTEAIDDSVLATVAAAREVRAQVPTVLPST